MSIFVILDRIDQIYFPLFEWLQLHVMEVYSFLGLSNFSWHFCGHCKHYMALSKQRKSKGLDHLDTAQLGCVYFCLPNPENGK